MNIAQCVWPRIYVFVDQKRATCSNKMFFSNGGSSQGKQVCVPFTYPQCGRRFSLFKPRLLACVVQMYLKGRVSTDPHHFCLFKAVGSLSSWQPFWSSVLSSFAGDGAKPRESELSDSLQGLIAHHFFCQVSDYASHKRISKCFLKLSPDFSLASSCVQTVSLNVVGGGVRHGLVSGGPAPNPLIWEGGLSHVPQCLNSKDDLS